MLNSLNQVAHGSLLWGPSVYRAPWAGAYFALPQINPVLFQANSKVSTKNCQILKQGPCNENATSIVINC